MSTFKILLIDDEPTILDISREFLGLDESISVDTATSADNALEQLRHIDYDAVVSDYQMPGKDGIQLLKEIRATGNKIPFILFTGKGREEIAIEAFENGADFYAQKGGETRAQFAELEHKIKRAIDLRRADLEVIALNRLYNVLSATNQAILRTHDKKKLLSKTCQIVIDIGGFSMAWAGFVNPETHLIEPVAAYGHINGHLDTIPISTEDVHLEQGPTWTAIRERTYNICNDIESDPTMAPWSEEALKRGYRSLAAFPFALGTKNAGVITYYASKPGFFSDQIIRLLDEQTDDLSFAFTILDNEEQQISAEDDLKNSETRYRRLFETAQDAILILDGDTGEIIEANAFILDLLGYPLEYCVGKHLWELGFIKDKAIAQQAFDELKAKGSIRYGNLPLETKDGQSVSVDFIGHAFLVGDKKIFQCSIRDITAQKLNDKAMREHEERLRTYLDFSPEGIVIVDAMGNVQDVNSTVCSMLNYSKEYLLDHNIAVIVDKSVIQEIPNAFQQLNQNGMFDTETLLVKKDGASVQIFLNAVKLPDQNYMAFLTDITERKRAEKLLLESEEKYRAIMDQAAYVIIMHNEEGRIMDVNQKTCQSLGYSREELLSMSISDIDQDATHEGKNEMWKAILAGENFMFESSLVRKDGSTVPIELTLSSVQLPLGPALLGIGQDITDRKRADDERERIRLWQVGVNKILESVLAPVPLDQKMKIITDGVVETFGADFCRIWLIEKGDLCNTDCIHAEVTEGPHACQYRDKCLHLKASSGRYTHIDGKGHRRVPFGAYKIGRIASGDEERFLTNDAEHDPRVHNHEWVKSLGLVAFSGYRLKPPDEDVLGVFALFTKFPISPDMDSVLMGLSRAISLAVQKDIIDKTLHESEERLRTIIDQSPLSIQVMSTDGRTVQVNHAFEELWEVTLRDLNDYNMLEDAQLTRLEIMPLIARGFSGETVNIPPVLYDGSKTLGFGAKKWIKGNIYPVRDEAGSIRNVILVQEDITELKRIEEAYHETNRKLNLLSGITRHDINNQLTALVGYLTLLDRQHFDHSSGEYLQKAKVVAERISTMIQFTKTYEDIGNQAPVWQNVRTMVQNEARYILQGPIKLVNDVPPDIEVFADPLMAKVFHNLIDNAVRHGEKISSIHFYLEERNGSHAIICEDDGVGISAEIEKELFTHTSDDGHGFGLFLSREILAITDITIEEIGEMGKGARFEIAVPNEGYRHTRQT